MFEHLPEEIRSEIFNCLPTKSVGRFRCVSKEWRSFLSSRQFVKSHLNFNLRRHPLHLLVMGFDNNCYDLTLNSSSSSSADSSEEDGTLRKVRCPLENEKFFRLPRLGSSCHGLAIVNVGDGHIRFLMNPITGEALRVRNWPPGRVSGMVHGLGYDSSHDDYKIVNISLCLGGRSVDVYSVRMNCWRKCPISQDGFKLPLDGVNGVFVNGNLHWLGKVDDPSIHFRSYRSVICAFNLAQEEFEEVEPPSASSFELPFGGKFEIKLLGGCLALMLKPFTNMKYLSSVDVWLMKAYGVRDSWTKLTINTHGAIWKNILHYEVISLLNEDEVVLSNQCRLFAYNHRSGVWRNLKVSGLSAEVPFRSLPLGESLLSPNYN